MGYVVVVAILVLIAAAFIWIGKLEGDRGQSDVHLRPVGVAMLIFAAILYTIGGIKHVPTRNIGIPSSLSNVGANAYSAGYHLTFQPWINLTDVPETYQTVNFEGCQGQYCTSPDQPRGNCLEVRIGGQQTACVDVTVQYQVNRNGAGTLYNHYAGQDGTLTTAIRDYLIDRELRTVENTDLDAYNPILDAKNFAAGGQAGANSQFLKFASEIQGQMQQDLGSDITVVKVLQPLAYYTASTEGFLHQIQDKAAQDQVEIEQQQVNLDTKTALANLGTPTVAQLEYLCLTSTAPRPPGWTCNFGAGATTTPVTIPAGK